MYTPSTRAQVGYRVIFSDGTVMYPKLPGHVNPYMLAEQYARETLSKDKETPVSVVSVEPM